MALTSDGKTIMIVMRTDGDGPCHPPSHGMGEQGIYRPYFQSYSTGGYKASHPRLYLFMYFSSWRNRELTCSTHARTYARIRR